MRSLTKVFAFALLLVFANASSIFSQGVLIFEISKPGNKPINELDVTIQKNGSTAKSYKTNAEGRVVDMSITEGMYTYNIPYGDYQKDTFSIKDGEYTWINIDYRELKIQFKNDSGVPLPNKLLTLYKMGDDSTETYVGEKMSDTNGNVTFVIPEGNYHYVSLKGDKYVTVKDDNINNDVNVNSGEITHQTYFCFVKTDSLQKKTRTKVFAQGIAISKIENGNSIDFGEIDAHSDTIVNNFYYYDITDNSTSCISGTYSYSVLTKDYGPLNGTFVITENTLIENNIVYIELPKADDSNGQGGNSDPFDPGNLDTIVVGTPIILTIKVLSAKDSTPIAGAATNLISLDYNQKSKYITSDSSGMAEWLFSTANTCHVVVLNDTMKNVSITKDTTVYFYLDEANYTKVFFDFYHGDEKFNPESVSFINISRQEGMWGSMGYTMTIGKFNSTSLEYEYDQRPFLCAIGNYIYKFRIKEKNYDQTWIDTVHVKKGDTEIHEPIQLKRSFQVDIYITDLENNLETRKYITKETDAFSLKILTDSLGHYSESMHEGDYTFIAFGDTQKITLTADTTLYFKMRDNYQNVKFQFIHDGNLVYPQIMNMDIYEEGGEELYSRIISTLKKNYNGNETAWVFEESTKCEAGKYVIQYILKDYEFDGSFQHEFTTNGTGSKDTLVYIVIPVKRNVTITIKDANENLVTGVFGKIFKYNEDGTLSDDEKYDLSFHGKIKTNTSGEMIDHLLPGRYQLQIINMKRDFIVSDYDLAFDIISGQSMINVIYKVLYKNTDLPAVHLQLDVNKEEQFYNTSYTDSKGCIYLPSEAAQYSYYLHYGENHKDSYTINRDTTIHIYIEDPILIDSMEIQGCACLALGDSINLSVLYKPSNATMKDVKWSNDKEYLATISSTGVLVANNYNEEGYITVTAKSMDGSDMVATRKIHIGNGVCGSEQELSIGDFDKREDVLASDSISLHVKNVTEEEFERVFIYQTSNDSINWGNIYGPTTARNIKIAAADYATDDSFFRVIASTNTSEAENFAKAGIAGCESDRISNIAICRTNNLAPINWNDSICATQKETTLRIDTTTIGTLPDGVVIKWYTQAIGDSTFLPIADTDNKDSITVAINKSTEYKVTLERDNFILKEYKSNIFVEDTLVFSLKADEDTICKGTDVVLSVNISEGKASEYLWQDNSMATTNTVKADTINYSVTIETEHHLCPAKTYSIKLTIDQPIELDLISDKDSVCSSSAVKLSATSTERTDLTYQWGHDATVSGQETTVYPDQNSTYQVTANTKLGKCTSVTKEKSIMVSMPIDFTLKCSADTLCTGSDITISTEIKSGDPKFKWNDDEISDNSSLTLVAIDSVYYLEVSDLNNLCPSKKDSIKIKVDQPIEISISGDKESICVTENKPVALTFVNGLNPISKLTWDNGSQNKMISVLPKETTTYHVSASSLYGKCEDANADYTVKVNGIIKTNLEASSNSICQAGENKVSLTVHTEAGNPNTFIWWDGVTTSDSIRIVTPDSSFSYWAMATDSICDNSDKDEVSIQVAHPASISLTTTNTMFEYGGTIHLIATPSSFIYGPYSWIAIDNDGEENIVAETEENTFSEMPYGDTQYYVSAQNGACPEMRSSMIIAKLMDNTDIPTVFTPHEKNGENDDFMPGYKVTIYDRYGNVISDSDNGWDGNYRGEVADAGVYIYVLTLKDNRIKKGTIEVYRK